LGGVIGKYDTLTASLGARISARFPSFEGI
jgi:hypothetical protein